MNYHEAFSKQTFFRDCITFDNFVGFVVAREYISNVHLLPNVPETQRHSFYMFLLKLLRVSLSLLTSFLFFHQGDNASVINCLKDCSCMSSELLNAISNRFGFFIHLLTAIDLNFFVIWMNQWTIRIRALSQRSLFRITQKWMSSQELFFIETVLLVVHIVCFLFLNHAQVNFYDDSLSAFNCRILNRPPPFVTSFLCIMMHFFVLTQKIIVVRQKRRKYLPLITSGNSISQTFIFFLSQCYASSPLF